MPNKEIKSMANSKTVDSVKMKMSDAEWLKRCEERYTFKGLAALYGKAIDEVDELKQKLLKANNELIGKDAKIASMQNACDPLVIEGACSIVYWLYQATLENPDCISFQLTEKCFQDLKRIGEGLHDYQNDKPNPFADEYFSGLTYAEIAELAKKSIRLTTEHCEDMHKIEELEEKLTTTYMKLNATNTANEGIQLLLEELEEKNKKLDKEAQDLYNKNLELQGELAICKKEAMQIKAFLTEWSSQDNRGMAFPYYYTIADENYRFEQDNGGEYFFDSHAGTIVKIADVLQEEFSNDNIEDVTEKELKDILENIGTCAEDDRIDDWLRNYNDTGIQRYTKEYETYYEGVFFTKTDAEAYLESTMNHHFGENPRIYADSFNKWGRHSQTEEFLKDLFNYFGVKVPPEMYYENKKREEAAKGGKNE